VNLKSLYSNESVYQYITGPCRKWANARLKKMLGERSNNVNRTASPQSINVCSAIIAFSKRKAANKKWLAGFAPL
jgi:hypothetical protein